MLIFYKKFSCICCITFTVDILSLLDWGVELSLPHRIEMIDGKRVHIVNEDDLIACFEENISETVVKEIAKKQPTRVVFRDSSFNSDGNRINVEEIFKLQSPWTVKNPDGQNPNEKLVVKEKCYLFDFSLDRALKQVAEYSSKLNVKDTKPEEKVAEFIGFLPVICYDGSRMDEIGAQDIMDIIVSGTGATMLARRWGSASLVNVTNDVLSKVLNSEKAMEALEKIEAFRNLKQDIKAIVNKSEEIKKVKKEKQDSLTKKEKQELTEEEKEIKSKRKKIQEQLLQFAKRVPVFMYLTDDREQTLLDVIQQLETELFTSVTNLTIDDFNLLIELGVFSESTMNDAVLAFKRFEDASLNYLDEDAEKDQTIGAWNTKVTREELFNRDFEDSTLLKN